MPGSHRCEKKAIRLIHLFSLSFSAQIACDLRSSIKRESVAEKRAAHTKDLCAELGLDMAPPAPAAESTPVTPSASSIRT